MHPESDNQVLEIFRVITQNAPLSTALNLHREHEDQSQAELGPKDPIFHLLLEATLAFVVAMISVRSVEMLGKILFWEAEPDETLRVENMKQELTVFYIEESMSDPNTPQFITLLWMALEDNPGLSSEAMVHCYIMDPL